MMFSSLILVSVFLQPVLSAWVVPASGNYTAWRSQLTAHAHEYCRNPDSFAEITDTSGFLGRTYRSLGQINTFRNILDHLVTRKDFRFSMTVLGDAWIPLGVICALTIIIFLLFSLAQIQPVRRAYALCTCWFLCNDRPRTSLKRRCSIRKTVAVICFVIFGIGFFICAAVELLAGASGGQSGLDIFFCDTYQTFRGLLFGTDIFSEGSLKSASSSWPGLDRIHKTINFVVSDSLLIRPAADVEAYLSQLTQKMTSALTEGQASLQSAAALSKTGVKPYDMSYYFGVQASALVIQLQAIDKDIQSTSSQLQTSIQSVLEEAQKSTTLKASLQPILDFIHSILPPVGDILNYLETAGTILHSPLSFLSPEPDDTPRNRDTGFIMIVFYVLLGFATLAMLFGWLVYGSWLHAWMKQKPPRFIITGFTAGSSMFYGVLGVFAIVVACIVFTALGFTSAACTIVRQDWIADGKWDTLFQNETFGTKIDAASLFRQCLTEEGNFLQALGLSDATVQAASKNVASLHDRLTTTVDTAFSSLGVDTLRDSIESVIDNSIWVALPTSLKKDSALTTMGVQLDSRTAACTGLPPGIFPECPKTISGELTNTTATVLGLRQHQEFLNKLLPTYRFCLSPTLCRVSPSYIPLTSTTDPTVLKNARLEATDVTAFDDAVLTAQNKRRLLDDPKVATCGAKGPCSFDDFALRDDSYLKQSLVDVSNALAAFSPQTIVSDIWALPSFEEIIDTANALNPTMFQCHFPREAATYVLSGACDSTFPPFVLADLALAFYWVAGIVMMIVTFGMWHYARDLCHFEILLERKKSDDDLEVGQEAPTAEARPAAPDRFIPPDQGRPVPV